MFLEIRSLDILKDRYPRGDFWYFLIKNLKNMDNIDLVYSFFSQFTFKIAKDNIDLIMSYFRRQIPGGRNGNKLIFDLLEAIKSNM